MGKQNSFDQTQRRQKIIDFIKENGPVKSGVICEALSLSRSSLSDDIRAINAQAPVLISPKRGYYTYDPAHENMLSNGTLRGSVDKPHIRQWLILSLLSERPFTFQSLCRSLREIYASASGNSQENKHSDLISWSNETIQEDLNDLIRIGYVSKNKSSDLPVYHSTVLHAVSQDMALRYCINRNQNTTASRMPASAYRSVEEKLSHCIYNGYLFIKKPVTVRQVGRNTDISSDQLELLQRFQQYPYSEKVLTIPYRTNDGRMITRSFSTGLILYSAETDRIYLLGKDSTEKKVIIALDHIQIDRIRKQDQYHTIYNSPEFQRIYEEMFHLSVEDPVTVRVRFVNLHFIESKVLRLCEVRKHAKIEYTCGNKEIVYTDVLRGIEDFARYLRQYGHRALAEEPKELRDRMVKTSKNILGLYE